MKNFIQSSLILACLFIATQSIAQQEKSNQSLPKVVTDSIHVHGVCGECKARIENAVDLKGVKMAHYDVKKELLTITYNTKKISRSQIQQAIANSGHDTEDIKASASAYSSLNPCCKYRDENNPHKHHDHDDDDHDHDHEEDEDHDHSK